MRGAGPLEPAARNPSHPQSEPQILVDLADHVNIRAVQGQLEREAASSPQSRSLNSPKRTSPRKLTKSPPAPKASSRSWMQSQSHDRSPHDKAVAESGSEDIDPFSPLSVSIPTDELLDDGFMNSLSFSNRGSVMFGGQRILPADQTMEKPEPVAATAADTKDARAEAPSSQETRAEDSVVTSGVEADGHTDGNGDTEAEANVNAHGNGNGDVADKDHIVSAETDSSSRLTPTATPGANTTSQAESMSQPDTVITDETAPSSQDTVPNAVPRPRGQLSVPGVPVSPDDLEQESQKVRSLYAAPNEFRWEDGAPASSGEPLETTPEAPAEEELAADQDKRQM
jgi:hypothetical protein